MKKLRSAGIAALAAVIGFSFTACGDGSGDGTDPGDGGHTHQWGKWVAITPATEKKDGEEKRTCTLDPAHIETRTAYATGTEGLTYITLNGSDMGSKENYTYAVSGIKPSKNTVHIPAYYRTYDYNDYNYETREFETIYVPVTEIWIFAFRDDSVITTVTFQEGSPLQTIWDRAIDNCTLLKSIELPAGLTTINSFAFNDCTAITEITIPASVTAIEYGTFRNWTSSQTIYIKGFANQTDADAAWGENWRKQRPIFLPSSWSYEDIKAQIVYQGGQ